MKTDRQTSSCCTCDRNCLQAAGAMMLVATVVVAAAAVVAGADKVVAAASVRVTAVTMAADQ